PDSRSSRVAFVTSRSIVGAPLQVGERRPYGPDRARRHARARDGPALAAGPSRGAGGNRTPVRRAVTDRATTIPVIAASRLPHRRVGWPCEEDRRRVFPRCQWSFPPSAVFPAVNHRFCCQAAVIWPRVPLLVAIALVHLGWIRRRGRTARCRHPFKESEQLRSHGPAPGLDVETDQPL